MTIKKSLLLLVIAWVLEDVDSFNILESFAAKKANPKASSATKTAFLDGLDDRSAFNKPTKERTELVTALTLDNPTQSPGSTGSFSPFAVGTWSIVYAPHISTMGGLAGGAFDPVMYELRPNGSMTSHARYDFPIVGSGWLSVSGTYGSKDEDQVCQVDFDKAWVTLSEGDDEVQPYEDLESVPSGLWKDIVQTVGNMGFVKAVSVFPVSYLDEDTIVFDFELLGTRICARKLGPVSKR
jgi:hypothetical protein